MGIRFLLRIGGGSMQRRSSFGSDYSPTRQQAYGAVLVLGRDVGFEFPAGWVFHAPTKRQFSVLHAYATAFDLLLHLS
jgi:hypothetical protein